MGKAWSPAFTTKVSQQLVACLADPSGDATRRFAHAAREALAVSGCYLDELGRTLWVQEFLAVLPRQVFAAVNDASHREPAVRGLVDHVLRQRADARASGTEPATPGELRHDLIELLRGLDEQARTGRLPPYLPPDADVTALSRTVRVRLEVRDPASPMNGEDPGRQADGMYWLPGERSQDSEPPRPWPQVAGKHPRLVVLADPGLGKSWLIRTETHRLCQEALARLTDGSLPAQPVAIPVPLRCDQLAAAPGPDLADKTAGYLVAQGLMAARSRAGVAAMVRTGAAVVLLDALDELTEAERGPVEDLVRSWAHQAGDRARCIITSRIAGYTGSPLPGAREVELQAFTPEDAAAAIEAWRLPPTAASELRDRLRDPATGAMARIPLLLALLCSLAAQEPGGKALPETRGQLYERMLRWFLTGGHRSVDDPGAPALDNLKVEDLLQILAPLAFTFATQPAGWTDLMPADSVLNAIRAAGPTFTERGRPATEVLRDLSVGAGVLVPDGNPSAGRNARYLFLHRTVAEYLTARHLATLPEADWLAIVARHQWFDPDWVEVIPMLCERLSPDGARALIQHLLASEPDPFHHALLTAVRVWGARPDADHLLAPRQADELAGRLDDLLQHWQTRHAARLACGGMTYLPRPVLSRSIARLADQDINVLSAIDELARRHDPGVTEALLSCLTNQDRIVRHATVEALAGRRDPGVTEALLGCLADQEKYVQRAAVKALARRPGADVTEALLGCLADLDEDVKRAAVEALARRPGADVTEALLGCLTDQDRIVRHAVAEGLDGRQRPGPLEAILGWLARHATVEALAGRRDPGVTEALLGCLTDHDRTIRYVAVKAVAGRRDTGVTEALLSCLTDQDVGHAAVDALARRPGADVTEALLSCLTDQNKYMRRAAVEALARRPGADVTEALLSCLTDHDEDVQRAAVKALARRPGADVTEALLSCLTDQKKYMRRAAVEALARRPGADVTEALLSCLTDHDEDVQRAAVKALARRPGADVTEALLSCLTDQNKYMRRAAVEALARRPGADVTEALLSCLTDHDEDVQRAAVEALAGRPGADVTEALLSCLTSQNESLRETAARVLGECDSPEILLILARLVHTLNQPSLHAAAHTAEPLMTRLYRRIDPADQPEVFAAMGWLTTAALSDRSA